MIKFENIEVVGWEAAIRGMRNPMNSWEKSDSLFIPFNMCDDEEDLRLANMCHDKAPMIKENDHDLMMSLRNAGTDHRKFMRMITVYVDITAPLYWWKEFDTYKVGTVANSCSTMHKIHEKEFTIDDFSCEHLMHAAIVELSHIIDTMNQSRRIYLYGGELCDKYGDWTHFDPKSKDVWWQMIQLLPSSYNQKRTVMMNYEVLANIYESRKNHKLDEWSIGFIEWIESLPYSELICGPEFLRRELYVGIDLAHGDDMKGGL